MAGGVCGGLAEYLDADATLVRLATVVLTLCFPPLFLAYLLAWIIVPAGPEMEAEVVSPGAAEARPATRERSHSPQLVAGFVLVALGLFLLAERLGLFDLWVFRWIRWGNLWPLALVGLGIYLVVRGLSTSGGPPEGARSGGADPAAERPPTD